MEGLEAEAEAWPQPAKVTDPSRHPVIRRGVSVLAARKASWLFARRGKKLESDSFFSPLLWVTGYLGEILKASESQ